MLQLPVIRAAREGDRDALWSILEPIVRAGEAYALPRDLTREQTLAYWLDHETFVAEVDGVIAGTYFIHANQRGGGGHVANCGYATAQAFAGRGIARAMCLHSLDRARARGFRAMQFNFVIATNERAVHLWQTLGFAIVGRLPGAFAHPTKGFVDVLVMYRGL